MNRPLRIALAGNPNAGKTTLFNHLTGSHQKVGNYAGVTVDTKEGRLEHRGQTVLVYDLPGTYSLTAYSLDEIIARDFLLTEKPDVIVNVLDATNLERNLYLCLQFQELGIPLVGALNIVDQAEAMGLAINERQLSRLLGIPMIRTVGPRGTGLGPLLDEVFAVHAKALEAGPPVPPSPYPEDLELVLAAVMAELNTDPEFCQRFPVRWLALKLLEKDADARQRLAGHPRASNVARILEEGIASLERQRGRDCEILVSEARYGYLHGATKETLTRQAATVTMTARLDAVLINRVVGLPLFLLLLWGIFQATFTLGAYPQAWLEQGFAWLSEVVRGVAAPGLAQSLLVDGLLGGVGGVFSFVPLIILLFLFISLLEDTGYMSRAAFVMDRFLHVFGLHGQSFLPMMLGFGCSVPAILAARTLKSTKDRIVTILVTPFMSCGAKLPVYLVLAGAFFAENEGAVVLSIYLVGVALALASSWVLGKTVLRREATPFVMELPPYRLPGARSVLWHVAEKSLLYVKKAGTVILAAAVLIWALTAFPQTEATGRQAMEQSYAGQVGKFLEPAVQPMGFDWKLAMATVTGFAAKEVVVSTMGVVYAVGDADPQESLRTALRSDPALNPLVAYVFMLFTLILAPCFAAQATIRAELGWRWLGFYLVASIAVSWGVCTLVYQLGRSLGWGG